MVDMFRVLTAATMAWALVALARQLFVARGRTDHSRSAGSASRGVAYSFTTAMLPRNKESARLHPLAFGIGVVLHLGVLVALLDLALLTFWPAATGWIEPYAWPVLVVAFAAGVSLLVRRARSPVLGAMSSAEDFIAITAVSGWLGLTALHALQLVPASVLLGWAALLLIYLPLGKLRHAVFFFAARAELGRRLGRRGTYPPAKERAHV